MKHCRNCGQTKPLDQFHKRSLSRDGHHSQCKACLCAAAVKWGRANRAANRAAINARKRDAYQITHPPKPKKSDAELAEMAKIRSARYRKKYPERVAASQAAWQTRNPGLAAARAADYYAMNPERATAASRTWSRLNVERVKRNAQAWRAANPEKWRLLYAMRRAREQSAFIPFTAEQLTAKFGYWNDCCWICGEQATAVDHVKPLARGGAHMLANLRPICKPCNSSKHAKWPLPSRAALLGLIGD